LKQQQPHDDAQIKNNYGFFGALVQKVWNLPTLNAKFPELKHAKFVEMWAHNRPHASGHQMHFDSDDEGRGGVIKNPIVSTILYITDDGGGGPSLVTNQKCNSTTLATKAWLAHPKTQRLVAFDGSVLHGVVPGKGVVGPRQRRVTLMFAFWKHIRVRTGEGPGSARPFPTTTTNSNKQQQQQWVRDLVNPSVKVKESTTVTEEAPIILDTVYETLDGEPWKAKYGMPDYEQVFQGF
jgi:hypothetical protein